MNLPVRGLGETVCDLVPEHIAQARAAAERLREAGFDIEITPARKTDGVWFTSESIFFSPLRNPPLKGAPAEALVLAVSEHEDVLSEIEQALGVAAEFSDFRQLSQDYPALTLHQNGQALGRLIVTTYIPSPGKSSKPSAPVIVRLCFDAARLSVSEAEALEGGDMVVLRHGPWPLIRGCDGPERILSGPGMPPLGLDPLSGTLVATLSQHPYPLSNPLGQGKVRAMSVSEQHSSDEEFSALSVPVAIHLVDTAITQSELARMAQTGTFDIGAVAEGLSAELSVAGRCIGRGEIVRIGDRFAVLLDQTQTEKASPQDTGEQSDPKNAGKTSSELSGSSI